MRSKTSKRILILGIGNILWADEGFGVRTVEQLHQHHHFPPNVTLLDGGTQGLYLLHHIQNCDYLIIFDAIDYQLAPGTLRLLEDEAVPQYLGAKKMSLHQTGFQEVLATATMLGQYPEQLLLIGVQPENIDDFGGSLTPLCQSRIAPAINAALSWLLQRGVQAQARSAPLPATQLLAGAEINRQTYESQRPSSNQACRLGDERVLNSQRYQLQYRPQVLAEDGVISCDVDHRGKY